MKINFTFLFSLIVPSVYACESTLWPDELELNAIECRNPRVFLPSKALKDFYFSINSGQLKIEKSQNDTFSLQTSGEEDSLKKISFSFNSQGLVLEDKNEPLQQNLFENKDLGSYVNMNYTNIFSIGTSIIIKGNKIYRSVGEYNNNTNQQGIITENDLKRYGEGFYLRLNGRDVSLVNAQVDSKGHLLSGKITSGFVEQNGKTYSAGTIFDQGYPDRGDIQSVTTSQKVMDTPKPKEKTIITIHLPKQSSDWKVTFQGKGNSETKIDFLHTNKVKGKFSGNAVLNALESNTNYLNLEANDNAKMRWEGVIQDSLSLKGRGNSYLDYIQKQSRNFKCLRIIGENNSKITLNGNQSTCTELFNISLAERCNLNVQNLFVSAEREKALINSRDYGKGFFNSSFNSFTLTATDFSEIKIETLENALTKSKGEGFKLPNLHSEISIKNYGKIILSDWHNKIIVNVQGYGDFLYTSHVPMEALMVKAQDYGKAEFQTVLTRAKVTAKDHANILINEIIGLLDDTASDSAKIKVNKKPGKVFVF